MEQAQFKVVLLSCSVSGSVCTSPCGLTRHEVTIPSTGHEDTVPSTENWLVLGGETEGMGVLNLTCRSHSNSIHNVCLLAMLEVGDSLAIPHILPWTSTKSTSWRSGENAMLMCGITILSMCD